MEYLEESIDIIGVWICACIFKNTVDKYVKKKMEAYYEQQIRERRFKQRDNGAPRGRLTKQVDEKSEAKPKTVSESSS